MHRARKLNGYLNPQDILNLNLLRKRNYYSIAEADTRALESHRRAGIDACIGPLQRPLTLDRRIRKETGITGANNQKEAPKRPSAPISVYPLSSGEEHTRQALGNNLNE